MREHSSQRIAFSEITALTPLCVSEFRIEVGWWRSPFMYSETLVLIKETYSAIARYDVVVHSSNVTCFVIERVLMWTAQVVRDDLKLALCVHRLHMENEAQFRRYWLFRNTNSCYKSTIERNLNARPEDCNKLHACPSPRFSTYPMNLLNGRPKHCDVE